MSTSVIERVLRIRQAGRLVVGHLAATAGCIVFSKVYAVFGHGVQSAALSLMYLYPLLGGVLPYSALWLLVPALERVRDFRLGTNLYNAGLATLVCGSLLRGIFEIAGTASAYVPILMAAGWTMAAAGLLTAVPKNVRHHT